MINLSSNNQLDKFTSVPANDEWLPKFCDVLNIDYNPKNKIQLTNYTPDESYSADFNVNLCNLILSSKGVLIVDLSVEDDSYSDFNSDYNATDSFLDDLNYNTDSDFSYDDGNQDNQFEDVIDFEDTFAGHNYLLPLNDIKAIKLIRPKHFRHYLVIESNEGKYYFSTSKVTLMFDGQTKKMMPKFASQYHIPFSIDTNKK